MGESKNLEIKEKESKLESFNNFFANIGKKLTENVGAKRNESDTKKIVNSFFLQKTTIREISKILSDMKNKCSVDAFNLNNYCLRLLAPSISPFLCEVFNSCLNFGLLLDCLKTAKLIPIFKEGDESDPLNYRSISLLPVVGKIFEKIIFNRIIVFLNKEKVLNENQFGFRQNRSTIDALVELSENTQLNWLNSKQNTISIFLDLKKAFDTVNHQIILANCSSYGIRGHVLKILKSYLSKRFQYTEIGLKKSPMRSIKIGVPQGSIMGPLLFIIYINDLTLKTSDIKSILYADDTLVYTNSEPKTNETKINVILQKTASWLKRNRLTLNVEKTKCVDILKRVKNFEVFKYLGIQVDHKLSFQEHAKNLSKRMLGFCSLLYRIRKVLTTNQFVQVYRTYVQPVIQYGVLVYANTSNQVLKPLNQMVKK